MNKLLNTLFLVTASLASFAQSEIVTLSGKVLDSRQQPVSVGDAFLLSTRDSSLVKYAPIKEGSFSFGPIPKANYLVKLSCLGYVEQVQPVSLQGDKALILSVTESPSALGEVRVMASRKTFSNKNGNIKVNVDGSPLASMTDAVDLLAKLPAVQVTSNGEALSIIGKGEPLVYIDNQKVTIQDLQSLSVADIKTIDIIKNPSARYEAEGRAVILVTRKLNKKESFKTDLSQTASLKRYFHSRSGVNLSWKRSKLELKSNLQYNHLNLWESNGNDFLFPRRDIRSAYTVTSTGTRQQFIMGGGAYLQLKDADYISLSGTLREQREPFEIATTSFLRQAGVETHALTTNTNQSPRAYLNTNFNFSKTLPQQKGQFFGGSQYSRFSRTLESAIFNSINSEPQMRTQDRAQDYDIEAWATRADFSKSFKNGLTWEAGASLTTAAADAHLEIESYDPQSSDHSNYNYQENNQAVYTQASGKWKKLDYAGGLRVEHTDVKGRFANSSAPLIDKSNTQAFPKISASMPLDSTKSLTVSYAKSINRPNYSSISHITTYINPFFEWASNINIRPTITNELTASLQYKENTLALTYYHQRDPVFYSVEYLEPEERLRMINQNFAQQQGLNMTVTVPFKYRLWSSTNIFAAELSKVNASAAVTRLSRPYLYFYSTNEFKLPKQYTLGLTGWATTRRREGVFDRNALFAVDTSVTKSFQRLSCTLSFNDMFRSLTSTEKFTINDIASNGVYYEDVRELSLSMKYTFGSIKGTRYRNRDVNDNANRMN